MPEVPTAPRKLLFVCSQNKWRSLTAERLFAGALTDKPLVVLRIPDDYLFGDERLVALLRERLAAHLPLL